MLAKSDTEWGHLKSDIGILLGSLMSVGTWSWKVLDGFIVFSRHNTTPADHTDHGR
jgi:hypothetical protein